MLQPCPRNGASLGEEVVLATSGRAGEVTAGVGRVRSLAFLSILRADKVFPRSANATAYVQHSIPMNTRLVYALLMLWLSWVSVAWSAEEGEMVQKTIKEAAMAASTFSETRDKHAVLNLYTKDYVGIQDGETETRDSIEKWLSDYESELNKGSNLRFISALSNLQVRIPGSLAWATYDYVFQAIRKGELEAQDAGQCTTLLRKEGSTWLIQHEHCSKTRLNKERP